jgi:hypothetical protein
MKYFSSSGSRDAPINKGMPVEKPTLEGANPPFHRPDRYALKAEYKKPFVIIPSPTKSAIRGQGRDEKQPTLTDLMDMISQLSKK